MAKKGPKNPLSDEHKAAMAAGRIEGRAVREYLDALRSNKPKRGRKRTPESIAARLAKIDAEMTVADPLEELKLLQERRDLSDELATMSAGVDMSALEAEFVKVAKAYSQRQGISYATWREVGVEASVLKAAGIGRASA
jgi:ribonucleotide reductase alpha subunit